MRAEYELQLKELKEKMIKAEAFAVRCPVFSKKILGEIITGEECFVKFAPTYKSLSTYSGIARYLCTVSPDNRVIDNDKDGRKMHLYPIYINTLVEYNSQSKYGLDNIHKNIPVFFYDSLNSTFYCTDEELEGLLNALDNWKQSAVIKLDLDNLQREIKLAEDNAKEAIETLQRLKDQHTQATNVD